MLKSHSIGTLVLLLSLTTLTAPAYADHANCRELHEAAFLDEPKDVSMQIDHGIDLECKDMLGHTALITAINGASLDSFTLLMKQRVSTKVKSEYGDTALEHVRRKYAHIATDEGFDTMRGIYQSMINQLETVPN